MTFYDLPAVDASLNAVSTLFILSGFVCIKRGHQRAHRACMMAAVITSALFLGCYLTYHLQNSEPVRFTMQGWPRAVYFFTLLTHIPLAFLVPVLVILTVRHALKGDFVNHKRLARWTFPIWLYVSVTGVLVYLMLYQWWPSTMLLGR